MNKIENTQILLSAIIPTYNSEETLELTLQSIRIQTIPQEQIEILVIDGGSKDKTIEIARKYNTIIMENPKRLPAYALEIGIQHAKGRYVLKIASDEALVDKNSLKRRFEFLSNNQEMCCVGSNRLISPKFDKNHFSRSYLNQFGDPFTAFVYKKKGSEIETFKKNIIKIEPDGACILKVEKNKPYPILDGAANLLSLDFFKNNFSDEIKNINSILQMAEQSILRSGVVGFIDKDDVLHTVKAPFRGYLKKIKFRVVNNVFDQKISGYTNVAKQVPQLNRRKYLFVFYCLSLFLPFFHSFYYAIRYKDATFLAHFIYTEYTFFMIVYCMLRKVINMPMKNESYG